jgi:hypothetical protein
MKVTEAERRLFLMSPAEFNAYLAEVKRLEEVEDESERDDLDEMLDEIAADPIALAAYEEALLREVDEQ